MGLSTKQVSVDQELDWIPAVLQPRTLELPKPPVARRQQNPLQSEPVKCPRCDSINTKFCYYNNYNKSQPRHFCKACKRHWTKGGTLRNVPVGGGRKNKRMKRSNSGAGAGSNRSKKQMGTQSQPQSLNFPLGLDDSLLQNDSISSFTTKILGNNGGFMGLTLPVPQNQGLQFSFSSLSNFDTNPSSIPCFQSLIDFNYESKLEAAVEDPAITNLMGNTSSSIIDDNQTWEVPSSSTNEMELPNYWNWNDMVSADLNIPWDDDGTENHP